MTWTPERIKLMIDMKAEGATRTEIARALGLTRNQVCGKLNRLDGYKSPYQPKPSRSKSIGDWDGKVFEPWTEFRARRQAERAQMQA